MERFGDMIVVAETTARPGTNPTARWYAQRWEEPHGTTPRPASRQRVRRAVARVLFALATALAMPGQRETVSAWRCAVRGRSHECILSFTQTSLINYRSRP